MNVEITVLPDPDEALGLAGDVFAESAHPGLRGRVLASLRARAASRVTAATPVEALAATIADVGSLLSSLSPADWETPSALGDLDVKRDVAHLHGSDHYLGIKVGAWSGELPDDEDDHRSSGQRHVDYSASMSPHVVLAAWTEWSDALVGALRGLPASRLGEPAKYDRFEAPLGVVLVGRAFELWTHAEDICRVTSRPPRPPRPDVLAAMTDVAATLVPLGYRLRFGESADTLRLVLTGPGGGTWDLALGNEAPSGPTVLIAADAVDFCRVIAARLNHVDLDCDIVGDQALAERVLVGATQFALD